MTRSSFPSGFLPIDLRYLAEGDAWQRYLAAISTWLAAMQNIRADARFQLFKATRFRSLAGGDETDDGSYEVVVNGEQKRIRLSSAALSAANAVRTAKNQLLKSAVARIGRGEVALNVKSIEERFPEWQEFPLDRLNELTFFINPVGGCAARHKGVSYKFAICDMKGIRPDQALLAYTVPAEAGLFERLMLTGAPDRLGSFIGYNPPLADWVYSASAVFRELDASLKSVLLEKLRDGELVATDGGGAVQQTFWKDVNAGDDLASWRPGVLIRPAGTQDESGMKGDNAQVPQTRGKSYDDGPILSEIIADIEAGVPQAKAIKARLNEMEGPSPESKTKRFQRHLKKWRSQL